MGRKKLSQQEIDLRENIGRYITADMIEIHLRPDINVGGSEGSAQWDDSYGKAFGKNEEEQNIIDEWLTELISKKVGYPIKVIVKIHNRQGPSAFWFKRLKPATVIKLPKRSK